MSPSENFFVILGAAFALSSLVSLRHGKPSEGWPFIVVMLAFAVEIAASPFAAALSPAIPIVLSIALVIAAVVTFPRANVPPRNQSR